MVLKQTLVGIGATQEIYCSDLDSDGDLDLIRVSGGPAGATSYISWHENNNGIFGGAQNIKQLEKGRSIFVIDVDNDGDNDILYAQEWLDEVGWVENLGNGIFGSTHTLPTIGNSGAQSIFGDDIDGDGDIDILTASLAHYVSLYENLGGGIYGSQQILGTVPNANNVRTSDVDMDGDLDIIGSGLYHLFWIENYGNSVFGNYLTIPNLTSGIVSISVSDFDNDGDDDLLTASHNDNLISYSENLIHCDRQANYSENNNGNGNYSFTNTSFGSSYVSHWAFGDGTTSSLTNPNHTFLTNGQFDVILTIADSVGPNNFICLDYISKTFNVTSVPSPLPCHSGFVILSDTLGNNITVVNSSTGNNLTYFWEFGDGSTSSLQTPTHTYTNPGPFYLCLTIDNGNGCTNMYCDSIGENGVLFKGATGFTINVTLTSIESRNNDLDILIYPNPTTNQLTINTGQPIKDLIIIDITGKTIKTITTDLNIINVANLSDGIYFIQLITEERIITKKFVKQ